MHILNKKCLFQSSKKWKKHVSLQFPKKKKKVNKNYDLQKFMKKNFEYLEIRNTILNRI